MRSSLHEPERIPSIDRVTMSALEQWFHPHHPDQRHREDGPAVVLHLPLMREEQWWLNGRLHRLTRFRLSGTVLCEQWWEGDRLHRTDGPTMIEYYPHGQVKRERWYCNGRYDRPDGPAVIDHFDDGQVNCESWYRHGRRHRENGPAVIAYHKRHRPNQ
jgi:hypothetical protein